jgi:hypothetical protein
MSNIHNERLMEDLYYKHLEVQEKIFGEGDSMAEILALGLAQKEFEEMEG